MGYPTGTAMVLGTLTTSKDNATVQGGQVRMSQYQVRSNVPMFALHGIVSRPLPGAQVAMMHHAGDPGNAVGVGVNDPRYYKQGLADGTVGLAHHQGAHLLMFDDRIEVDGNDKAVTVQNARSVSVKSASKVLLDTPDVFTTGNLHVGSGASGTFSTPTGQVVTVRDGIIVNIF